MNPWKELVTFQITSPDKLRSSFVILVDGIHLLFSGFISRIDLKSASAAAVLARKKKCTGLR